jgi:hypothetical protein
MEQKSRVLGLEVYRNLTLSIHSKQCIFKTIKIYFVSLHLFTETRKHLRFSVSNKNEEKMTINLDGLAVLQQS